MKRAFALFIRHVKSDRIIREVADMLERRDLEGAMRLVDTYIVQFGNIMSRVFVGSAEAEAAEARRKLPGVVAISFDPSNPRAALLMRENRLTFIRDFSQEQRRATTRALSRALAQGQGTREAARAFQRSIGLTERQEEAVANYERLLGLGSNEALNRVLRDRRYDAAVRRASEAEPLRRSQIRRMVDRYRDRTLAMRAETIARTETVRISSIARQEGFRQALEDAGINGGLVIRIWNATNDARTRDSHAAMDGQEVAQDEPFISGAGNRLMFPGDPSAPPEETIQCRCVVTHRIKEAA